MMRAAGQCVSNVIRQLVCFSHRQRGFYKVRRQLDGKGAKQKSEVIIPEDCEERVHLPAVQAGGTRWGSECFCAVCCLHI